MQNNGHKKPCKSLVEMKFISTAPGTERGRIYLKTAIF